MLISSVHNIALFDEIIQSALRSDFYLRPLVRPREDVWYSCTPVGHNTLASTVSHILKQAGVSGFFTNHSLRATSVTRLFDAGLDEQLIMARTGHSSWCSLL